MCESGNMFEEFIKRFYIKYDKLQIEGFHNKNSKSYRSVSPTKRKAHMFNVHPKAE